MTVIEVLLADDHPVLRDGLQALLEEQADIRVVGHANNGLEAVHKGVELAPAVVIMDIVMPQLDGIEATRLLLRSSPVSRVVILSMYASREHIFRALQAGARGYLLKEAAGAEVVAAVRSVHAGQRYLSRKISDTVIDDYLRGHHESSGPLGLLSARERQVLQAVAEGHSTAEIAQVLNLSPKTVDTYRSRLLHKLGVGNTAGLIRLAFECGLTPP